jgi:hypothetical protein
MHGSLFLKSLEASRQQGLPGDSLPSPSARAPFSLLILDLSFSREQGLSLFTLFQSQVLETLEA